MVRLVSLFAALFILASCGAPPGGALDVSRSHASAQQKYLVTLSPLVDAVPINEIHSWEITLATSAGRPVTKARFDFDGGMPEHGHGFPTQPQVTKDLGDGRYLLEGVKFSMTGWWQMKLHIDSEFGPDDAIFNTVIGLPVLESAAAPPS